jgi:hypothetical protein
MTVGEDGNGDSDSDRGWALVKSTDGGVTWSDISSNVVDASSLPSNGFSGLVCVAVAPDDEDWLAVAGYEDETGDPMVVASKDGGDNFSYTGDMVDASAMTELESVFDLAVSIEVDDIHNIAVAGENNNGDGNNDGAIFRLRAGTWLSDSWVDTSANPATTGWNDSDAMDSDAVIAVAFSPNFDLDDTIVCLTLEDEGGSDDVGLPYVQSGIWESSNFDWNSEAGFADPVQITANGDTLWSVAAIRIMGLALPADYDGSDPGARVIYAYVNAWNDTTHLVGGNVCRIDNGSVSEPFGPSGDPLLASIDFHGDADTGKMMIGEYFQFDNAGGYDFNDPEAIMPEDWGPVHPDCCAGVRVWHTVELDPCCPDWEGACKDPSGSFMALVMYTPGGEKEYASSSGSIDESMGDLSEDGYYPEWWMMGGHSLGTPGDESAFSVSRDDAVSFNQIGLIDTDIDYLSDHAVCPDCSTHYLATINDDSDHPCGEGLCACDSVWRSYDGGDTWERVFHGEWQNDRQRLLLRLPCDEDACCDQDAAAPSGTVYLGLRGKDQIFYSRDCGQCWNDPPATKITIEDFAVETENTVHVIDNAGMYSMSTQYGRRWSDAADTGLDSGHKITSCCHEGFLAVGGFDDKKVAWSDDGGDNWNLTDALPVTPDNGVHVACDPVCDNIIYAALDGQSSGTGGIYRADVTDGSWTKISLMAMNYTGIVMAREGTLYASSDDILADKTKDCADRFGSGDYYSGVARNLGPCETDCCGMEDWDYLICGLSEPPDGYPEEDFDDMHWDGLDICGCLSIDTNSVLFAIDRNAHDGYYELCDGSDGALWAYEDCAAKMGPTLTSPADGSVLDCEPCAGCDAANFTLKWERMCEACSYDVQIMDEDGNLIVEWVDVEITGDPPTLFIDGTMDGDEYYLECGMTYTWHVREANTACECVHSPWSETWSFTVAVGAADAIQLLSPEKGAMGTPIENIGFSWTAVRNATSYSFVLSPNANLAGALVSQDMSTTAFNFVGPLDYSKAYYWQIVAWQDGTRLTTSSIGVFNTMAQPTTPPPPVVVEQQPAPVINIPPAEEITPVWIYAIIGIGAALAVVVIVLIVRTRRP